jgi:penicillin-binding protein 2
MSWFQRHRKSSDSTLPKRDVEAVFNRRAILLSGAGVVAMGAIAARMVYIQATDWVSQRYSAAADENRFDSRLIAPPRGVIYDRFGVPLAITSKDYRVSVIPERATDLEGVVRAVALLLDLDDAWVRRRVREAGANRIYEPTLLRQGLTWQEFSAINVRLPELPGVVAESTEVRSYPFDVVFAHPIGYVQKPNQRDLDRARAEDSARAIYYLHPDVRVGKAGVEVRLEETLRGDAGWRKVIVNAVGREMGEYPEARQEPRAGQSVVLTIDADLQRRAMEQFGSTDAPAQAGSVVVMDIVTGDLLVMASAPGFDPNHFVNGIGNAEFRTLNEDDKKPLFHKAVTGAYAPGSTFKMIVGIAAKQAGVEDNWRVSCPGYFVYGGRAFHCWRKGGHGSVNLHDALKFSCDVYFYQAALRAGPERIANVARAFGFGSAFDVSVPNVEDGVVPDPDWWRRIGRGQWTGGLTVNFGIGQGDLLVTPLQLATMAARIGNSGRAVIPRLLREAPGVRDPRPAGEVAGIDPEHLARVRDGMYGVCNESGGTAMRAGNLELVRRVDGVIVELTPETRRFPPVRIAGKTGTAQVRALTAATRGRHFSTIEWKYRDNALFVCFGPWDDPRYACAVVVEHGGAGSAVAGPIAREVMRATLLRDPARRPPARLAAIEARPEGAPA